MWIVLPQKVSEARVRLYGRQRIGAEFKQTVCCRPRYLIGYDYRRAIPVKT